MRGLRRKMNTDARTEACGRDTRRTTLRRTVESNHGNRVSPWGEMKPYTVIFETIYQKLADKFRVGVPGDPEDQLKGPVAELLEKVGRESDAEVVVKTESRVEDLGAIPDMGVARDGLLTGHVELKRPGIGARHENFKSRNRKQWKKYRELPNLLYTDGNEWALYRFGERVEFVRLAGDIATGGTGAITDDESAHLARILTSFLFWEPVSPRSVKALARVLAPLCRLLREEVLSALGTPGSAIGQQKTTWKETLFPDADDKQFADAYAQTVTYGLLLARLETQARLTIEQAARDLRAGHALLGEALRLLGHESARKELRLSMALLERQISAIDIEQIQRITDTDYDPWVYFYEDFLAEYDPRLRKNRGVYYTPFQVVNAQVKLAEDLLRNQLGKDLGFGTEGVLTLDPAVGTGTYPLVILNHVLRDIRDRFGDGAVSQFATRLASNLYAFELLVGPYTVSHLRLTEFVKGSGGELPDGGAQVYLTDTLDSPEPPKADQQTHLFIEKLALEHQRAQQVKAETPVLVCVGNPPYDREEREYDPTVSQPARRKGGWIRYGDPESSDDDGILEDFLRPVREAGQGGHLKNVYNDYVYFWRWALWKVFEQTEGPGICTFITASSYIRGPGFAGMRQHMRSILDELWILDLGGSQLGARKSENVFDIRTPVAIAIAFRRGDRASDEPADVHYYKVRGSRAEKLEYLHSLESIDDVEWEEARTEWMAPFLPEGSGDFASWPLVTQLFPWQHSGVQLKRTWPIGATKSVLKARWNNLVSAEDQGTAFRETATRNVGRGVKSLRPGEGHLPPIQHLDTENDPPPIVRYGYRSFDRQWIFEDARIGDRMRPQLWMTHSQRQLYLTSLLTKQLGDGPAALVTAYRPDLHHFCNRGGKDTIPLWREPTATEPNLTDGLLNLLTTTYQESVEPEDFFAYCYAMLASPEYCEEFKDQLAISAPRIPITKDGDLFFDAVELGNHLVFLHTYGDRFADRVDIDSLKGAARCNKSVSTDSQDYPDSFDYDPATQTLIVGDGEFGPVSEEVWQFSVSGFEVVKSWLAYRMKSGAGKKSSPLDDIRPERWTAELTVELLELLWGLEKTIEMYPAVDDLRATIQAGSLFNEDELPTPTKTEKKPKKRSELEKLQVQLL